MDEAWAVFRLFRALLRPWENWENEEEGEKGGEERYELTSFDVSVYKFVGLYGLACIIIFFSRINGLFHIGERVEKLVRRYQQKIFTRARRHNALSSFQSY